MKRITLLLMLLAVAALSMGQSSSGQGRFHLGLNYSYISTEMKVSAMSFQSVWKGDEYPVEELNSEQLEDLNAGNTFMKEYSGIGLEAGYVLLSKPGSHWQIDGSLILALMQASYDSRSTVFDSVYFQASSGMDNFSAGLKFRFDYAIDEHWGLSAVPYFIYAWGKPSEIDDQMYTSIPFFNESREFSFGYWYARLCPMAYYETGKVRISAGPGFYYMYLDTDYALKRQNPDTGFNFDDYVSTEAHSKSYVDGHVAISWQIIDPLTLAAFVAVGSDIIGHAGLAYTF